MRYTCFHRTPIFFCYRDRFGGTTVPVIHSYRYLPTYPTDIDDIYL